jgi:antibiotic biosynthesis monooxygenase (ABM) superfamily enzyme
MDGEHLQDTSVAPRWQVRVATTLAAWLTAFLVVTALLRVFGDQLGALPLELRALVLSGVLVGLMANVVMPTLTVVVPRWVTVKSDGPDGR